MRPSSKLIIEAIIVTTGASLTSQSAAASQVGQCYASLSAYRSALEGENLKVYALAQTFPDFRSKDQARLGSLIVAATMDGSKGYTIKSDVALDAKDLFTPDHQLCIDSELKDVAVTPQSAPFTRDQLTFKRDDKAADAECAIISASPHATNSRFGCQASTESYRNPIYRPLLKATLIKSRDDELPTGSTLIMSWITTDELTMVGKVGFENGGIISYATVKGNDVPRDVIVNAKFSAYIKAKIDINRQ